MTLLPLYYCLYEEGSLPRRVAPSEAGSSAVGTCVLCSILDHGALLGVKTLCRWLARLSVLRFCTLDAL